MDNTKQVPVWGWAGEEIIGHWDEKSHIFRPLQEGTMEEQEALYAGAYPWKPLVVNITRKRINGHYSTYRSFAAPTPRTIICKY